MKHGPDAGLDSCASVVGAWLFAPQCVIPADATIVLGMTLWRRPVARAVDLYRCGVAGRLVFTGGWNRTAATVEAVAMADAARSMGVPETDILVESCAANTAENFSLVRELLSAIGLITPGVRLNVVAVSYHLRRALLTARALLPPDVVLGAASYPSVHFGVEDWHRSARGRAVVLAEIDRIERYFGPQALDGIRDHCDRLRDPEVGTPCAR